MPSINWTRPELVKAKRQYTLIGDALAGSVQVKAKGSLYLPPPESLTSPDGRERYEGYKTRAVFYNVTKRTEQGLLGQLFSRAPIIEVSPELKFTEGNMDGLGMNATQQCKRTSGHVLAFGRAGLLADFPTLPDGREATRAELASGQVAPTITRYDAMQIINWRYQRDFTSKKLLFVILEEPREKYSDDGFSFTVAKQWRVCRLDEAGNYVQELYYDNKADPVSRVWPLDFAGNMLQAIPFQFIGSEDNDPDIDEPPMFSIADLNIAHYRNSADFEDSTFLVGQPTSVVAGVDQSWVTNVWKGETLRFGSRNLIPLPKDGRIDLVQADPNSLAQEGMAQKERQMVALGAKLVENKQVQRTATEASQEESAEASVLMTVADNTSVAYAQAFADANRFVSNGAAQINFRVNTAFEISNMDANSRAETIKEWQMGAITWAEMRQVLRRSGIATLPDDEAKALALKEESERAALLDSALGDNAKNSENQGA